MARATLVVAALVAFVTVAVRPLVPANAGHPVTGRAMAQEDPDPELYLPLALRQAAPVPVVTATPTPPPGSAPATDIPPHDTATAVPWTTTPGRTPEVTSTPIPGYADLAIGSVTIAMEDSRCYYGQPLGTLLRVDNVGAGAAASFVVEANGVRQAVPFGLAPGGWRDVWFPGYDGGNTVAIVDVTGAVAESNEDNNRHGGPVPIPTPPPSCPAP